MAMTWGINRLNMLSGVLALLGLVQFFYCVVAAMHRFPGGYVLHEHFLSDLGVTQTADGQDNSASAALFNRSIIGLGVSLLPFFCLMPSVLSRNAALVRASGVLSALGLIGIGATPYDRFLVEHFSALAVWLASLLVMAVSFTLSADLDRFGSTLLAGCTTGLAAAAGAYVFAGERTGYVIFQKTLVVVAVPWLCFVFVIVSFTTIRSLTTTRMIAEQQARDYLDAISKGYRRPRAKPDPDEPLPR